MIGCGGAQPSQIAMGVSGLKISKRKAHYYENSEQSKLKDIEEALLVIEQRKGLNEVISFVILHGAEQDLIDAV